MKDSIPSKVRIMDIAQNLARIGNWTADSYEQKKNLIERFLNQTNEYLEQALRSNQSENISYILNKFQKEFHLLKKEKITSQNKDRWAERILTWANILQHRASLTR